jgi:hypothetical protein
MYWVKGLSGSRLARDGRHVASKSKATGGKILAALRIPLEKRTPAPPQFHLGRRTQSNLHLLLYNGDVYLSYKLIGSPFGKVEPRQKKTCRTRAKVLRLPISFLIPRT